jgi:predicted lipid-binding transport protein (Tim44 family)
MRLTPALAVFCLIPLLAHATGEIYRWKDTSGVWHYSDQPQPGAELVKTARKPASATPASTDSAPTPAAAPSGADGLPPVSAEVAQQVRAEAADAKSDQCRKATEAYEKSIKARRMYRVDEKGEKTFLNDAELDQTRLSARSAKDIACGQQ